MRTKSDSDENEDEDDDEFSWYRECCGFGVRLSAFGLLCSPLALVPATMESEARWVDVAVGAAGWSIFYTPVLLLVVWCLHPLKREDPILKKAAALTCSSIPVFGFWGSLSYLFAVS